MAPPCSCWLIRAIDNPMKLVILLLVCALSSPPTFTTAVEVECLKIPRSEFVGSVKSTIDVIREVISTVSRFTGGFGGDFRLSNAVTDCLDLLDFSADELTWTLSASQNPTTTAGKDNKSGGRESADLRTWLGGALGNQDTCIDGFEGTNSFIKTIVASSLGQVTSLVRDLLATVRPSLDLDLDHQTTTTSAFPAWLKRKDRKLLQGANAGNVDAIVAADGSGNFTKVMDAIAAAPDNNSGRFVIYVKKGVYNEYVEIGKKKTNIMMIGDGMDNTVISGNHSFIDGWTTYRSATFAVKGKGFIARDMRFENTAGPEKHQAVAFRSDSDLSVIFRCAITGYQDTLYAHSMRQFYRDCLITGTVDFMFGDGVVVFQNCQIVARKGLPGQKNTITAQGRKEPTQPSGFTIQFSNITAEFNSTGTSTYLGRPWKPYSRTVFMQSHMSSAIRPEGWLEWNGDFALDTLYYGEYMNHGPGAGLGGRVNWTGLHAINDSSLANNFTVGQFLLGNSWLPSTGVKYAAGLAV